MCDAFDRPPVPDCLVPSRVRYTCRVVIRERLETFAFYWGEFSPVVFEVILRDELRVVFE